MEQFDEIVDYPPELKGRSNQFIVTQFDDSMTVEMQLRTLIKWIKENIKLTNEMVEYLNKFIKDFNENLYNTVDEILNKWVADGFFESLINEKIWESILQNFKDYFPSVKDFGAKGDGVTYDDKAFELALTERDYINITNGFYRISHLNRFNGKTINGIGDVTIIMDAHLIADNQPLLLLGSNCNYHNIKFVSEPLSKEWNRTDLKEQHNIKIMSCSFIGFTHVSTRPNAWGLYLDKTTNVYIDSCYFEDNSQSDIAIVEGCSDIFITNCTGKKLHINVEPNRPFPRGKNITIENCIIDKIDLQENNYLSDSFDMITISNSNIREFKYKGLNTTLNSCNIQVISTWVPNTPAVGDIYYGGVLKSNNSLRFSENLLTDSYINDLSQNADEGIETEWGYYSATSFENTFERSSDNDGKFFHINPNSYSASNIIVKSKKVVPVDSNTWYAVKMIYKPVLSAPVGYFRSLYTQLTLLNGNIQIGANKNISSHRWLDNPLKNLEQVALIYTGEATSLKIRCHPSTGNNADQLKVYGLGLYKISAAGKDNFDLPIVEGVRKFYTTENFYTKGFENNDELLGKESDNFYKKIWRNGKWNEINFS